MTDTHLKMQLEKATVDLDKTTDVEGILIVASDGRILHHNLRVDVDINLFGPMSQVISSSSVRLLDSSGQGKMERVLVESSGGKALFLGLENVHLIILMQDTTNVGMVMVNAKRASKKIHELTKDIELEVPEEIPIPAEVPSQEPVTPLSPDESEPEIVEIEKPLAETITATKKPVEITNQEAPEMKVTEEPGQGLIEDQTSKTIEESLTPVDHTKIPERVVAQP
ncbi:MAG: hypothetical protein Q4P17_00530, partial [Methanobacterium sp.]|nr:hypothetical protein [Methanobacterium sp.]